MRSCGPGLRESLLQQLAQLVSIAQSHVTAFLPAMFDVIRDFWNAHLEHVLYLIEEIARTTADAFAGYVTMVGGQRKRTNNSFFSHFSFFHHHPNSPFSHFYIFTFLHFHIFFIFSFFVTLEFRCLVSSRLVQVLPLLLSSLVVPRGISPSTFQESGIGVSAHQQGRDGSGAASALMKPLEQALTCCGVLRLILLPHVRTVAIGRRDGNHHNSCSLRLCFHTHTSTPMHEDTYAYIHTLILSLCNICVIPFPGSFSRPDAVQTAGPTSRTRSCDLSMAGTLVCWAPSVNK